MYKNCALSLLILFLTHGLSASENTNAQNLIFGIRTTAFFASLQANRFTYNNNNDSTESNNTSLKQYSPQTTSAQEQHAAALNALRKAKNPKTEEKFCQTDSKNIS